MKFKFGFPSEPDSMLDGARRLALPIKKTYIVATAIGSFIMLPLFYGMWRMRWSNDVIFGVFKADTILPLLSAMFVTVIAHEFCHLVMHPFCGLTDKSYVGLDKKTGLVYAQYLGVVSKMHFTAIGAAPLVIGTIISLWLASTMPEWASWLALASIFNAVGAGGDVYILAVAWREVPAQMSLQGHRFGKKPHRTWRSAIKKESEG